MQINQLTAIPNDSLLNVGTFKNNESDFSKILNTFFAVNNITDISTQNSQVYAIGDGSFSLNNFMISQIDFNISPQQLAGLKAFKLNDYNTDNFTLGSIDIKDSEQLADLISFLKQNSDMIAEISIDGKVVDKDEIFKMLSDENDTLNFQNILIFLPNLNISINNLNGNYQLNYFSDEGENNDNEFANNFIKFISEFKNSQFNSLVSDDITKVNTKENNNDIIFKSESNDDIVVNDNVLSKNVLNDTVVINENKSTTNLSGNNNNHKENIVESNISVNNFVKDDNKTTEYITISKNSSNESVKESVNLKNIINQVDIDINTSKDNNDLKQSLNFDKKIIDANNQQLNSKVTDTDEKIKDVLKDNVKMEMISEEVKTSGEDKIKLNEMGGKTEVTKSNNENLKTELISNRVDIDNTTKNKVNNSEKLIKDTLETNKMQNELNSANNNKANELQKEEIAEINKYGDIKINLKRNGNDNAKNEAKENLININDKDENNTTSELKTESKKQEANRNFSNLSNSDNMLQDNKKLKDNLTDMSFKNAIDTKKEEFFTNDKNFKVDVANNNYFDNIKNDIENFSGNFIKNEVQKNVKVHEIMREVNSFIANKQTRQLVLQIEPERLGKMRVSVEVVNEVVKANVEVENESVKRMIENNQNLLKDALIQQGLHLGSFTISLSNSFEKNSSNAAYANKKTQKKFKLKDELAKDEVLTDASAAVKQKNYGYNSYEYIV
ncbi:MAG TPA: flagellar hook-length control protein FliK [Ignavibacteriales bacterium]|mgnify:CR=1 FL=1|nr:flagellar hook-length control protein FliK [Ignavibacteriales bacterium]